MKEQNPQLNLGISKSFACSYLPNRQERIIVLIDSAENAPHFYHFLIKKGFRRNGDQLYRPHCERCQSCQSLRIPVKRFKASKSQIRTINKNKHLTCRMSKQPKKSYYRLYKRYINTIHRGGPMHPATQEEYDTFLFSSWNIPLFLEIYDGKKLISVSVIDQIISKKTRSWSAFYCFYDPDYRKNSIGKYSILSQISISLQHGIDWLYLGYQIDACQKMNYKTEFKPHQRFVDDEWKNN
ncbi:MAG: arginyltransferase [Psychromonas sp.]|nr:arginyltransferase [Psychromonas sp.]